MRLIVAPILSLAIGLAAGCGKKPGEDSSSKHSAPGTAVSQPLNPDTLLCVRFDGTEKLFAGTNAPLLKEIWSLPETQTFAGHVLDKLARVPFQFFQQHISGTNDFAAVFRPLLDDAVRSESFAELRGTNATQELVFAIRLSADRAQFWSTNLAAILQTWTGIGIVQDKTGGWELKKHDAPNLILFARSGDWVVLGIGQGELPLQKEILAAIQKNGRPMAANPNAWLEIAGDLPRLRPFISLPEPLAQSRMLLSVASKGDDLKTRVTLTAPDKFNLQLDPWRVPTNTIREPLISFTAARGVRPYLENSSLLREYHLQPAPDQIYFWAIDSQIPVLSYALAACDDATNMLHRIAPKLMSSLITNLFQRQFGRITWNTNESGLLWQGIMPVIVPFLQTVNEPAGQFLLAGLFPMQESRKPLPAELLSEVTANPNLVYYDWEITGNRILQWQNLAQLPDVIRGKAFFKISQPGENFLAVLRQRCGNCVTRVTLDKPNELLLERKSTVGFTGVELVFLVHWLDTMDFARAKP